MNSEQSLFRAAYSDIMNKIENSLNTEVKTKIDNLVSQFYSPSTIGFIEILAKDLYKKRNDNSTTHGLLQTASILDIIYQNLVFEIPARSWDISSVKNTEANKAFTILKHSIINSPSRSQSDILRISQVFPTDLPRTYIPLKCERLVLHAICKKIVLKYCLPDPYEDYLQKTVAKLMVLFLQKNPKISDKAEVVREEVQQNVIKHFNKPSSLQPQMASFIDALKQRSTNVNVKASETAIAQRTADFWVKYWIEGEVKNFDFDIELIPLPQQPNDSRRIYMVNGGISSGKGTTAEKNLQKEAESAKIVWKHFLKLNTDSFKKLLLPLEEVPSDQRLYYSGLVHDEASLIRSDILDSYKDMIKQGNAPHLFIDQVFPSSDIFELGQFCTGFGLTITVVHCPIEFSLRTAFNRGLESGRYEPTSSILRTHKEVPSALHESLKKQSSSIKLYIRATIPSALPVDIAFVDFASKQSRIYDRDHLLEFYKKIKLNPKATSIFELYLPDNELNDQVNNLVSQWKIFFL